MDNHGKVGKKLLLYNHVPFSLISWHSNKASYARGGDFLGTVSFFRPGGWSSALKSCHVVEILMEQISGPG